MRALLRCKHRGAGELGEHGNFAELLLRLRLNVRLIASAMPLASPQANSSLVCARIIVCCMMFGHQVVFITLL